jgi:hypothetical protein
MKITKSNEVLTSKPKTGVIKTSVTNQTIVKSLDDLEKIVLNNPFNSSNASGIAEKDWLSQQILTLDFDSGITPEEVIKRCRILAFNPNIIYTTYSDTPELRKFRVLFILDKEITDYKIMKWAQRGLMSLFKESDPACKDLCRMYYPGRKVIYRTEELNESDWFLQYTHAQVANDERFWEKFEYKSDADVVRPEKVNNFNWDNAIKEIKILHMFFNENYRMSYDILFGLITNAQYIYGGEKKIFDRMVEINKIGGGTYFPDVKRGIEKYPTNYFYSLKAVKKFNYLPKQLQNFSPFEEDWDFRNILEVKFKKGKIEKIKETELISIDEATRLMKDVFDLAKQGVPFDIRYSSPDPIDGLSRPYTHKLDALFNSVPENPIYIFKITTGAGKSQAFLNETNALLAFPFHSLKEEMSGRMLVNHKVTPESPFFSTTLINDTISQLRDSGLYTEVGNIIKSISKDKLNISGTSIDLTDKDILMAQNYIEVNAYCRVDDTTVLTTHTRAVNDLMSFKHEFVIFDEDPLNDIVDIDSISLDFTQFDGSPYKAFVEPIEDFLRNVPMNCVLKMPRFNKPRGFDKFSASVGKGKLIKLLQSDYIYKDGHDTTKVNFCLRKSFLEDKKIFIMSATAPIPIYKKLYGDRVIVIDITNIRPMGVVEQYTKRSFSSNGMLNYNMKVYKDLFDEVQGTKVITHLKYSNRFDKSLLRLSDGMPHSYYFGKCSGGDKLNGYDVSVVGTPNKPSFVYLFIAELIGLPNSINQELYDQVIEWNDFRFRFFTYEDPTLRDIQLSLIESELLQAAGRSRFLRNKNTTKIFSSLPLKITTKFIEK